MSDDLRIALADALVYAADLTILPADLKSDVLAIKKDLRDTREPGRRQKMRDEKKLQRLIRRVLLRQADSVQNYLTALYPARTMKADPLPDMDWDDDEIAELVVFLTAAAREGIKIFGEKSNVKLDLTLVNTKAANWARKYAGEVIDGLNKTTRAALKEAIAAFVDTPGMTIGDAMKLMPFEPERARMVAVTEITRTYAEANQLAANELAEEFPGVQVTKVWFTNNDDLVCDICGPLNNKEVPYDEGWGEDGEPDPEGLLQPPAHPRCRCWTDFTTKL